MYDVFSWYSQSPFICSHLLLTVSGKHTRISAFFFSFFFFLSSFTVFNLSYYYRISKRLKQFNYSIWLYEQQSQIINFLQQQLFQSPPKKNCPKACKICRQIMSYILSSLCFAYNKILKVIKHTVYIPQWIASSLWAGTYVSSSLGHQWPAQHLGYNAHPINLFEALK